MKDPKRLTLERLRMKVSKLFNREKPITELYMESTREKIDDVR